MSSYELYSIMGLLVGFSSIVMFGLCGMAAWWLNQSRATGGRWMLWGMLLQVLRLMEYAYERLCNLSGGMHEPLVGMYYIVWLISGIGLLLFAIGLFLHAKNQRGLRARLDELEFILADMQSRER